MTRCKTALVLGGGGTLGAVQVGFVRRLNELAIPIDFVVGTSVGAVNAAYVAFHDDPGHDCFEQIWSGLTQQAPLPPQSGIRAEDLPRHADEPVRQQARSRIGP